MMRSARASDKRHQLHLFSEHKSIYFQIAKPPTPLVRLLALFVAAIILFAATQTLLAGLLIGHSSKKDLSCMPKKIRLGVTRSADPILP